MSSTEQAFVKAFARRNRAGDATDPTTLDPRPTAVDRSAAASSNRNAAAGQVWIPSQGDAYARADQAELEVPKPHVDPAAAVEHIHTEYAAAAPLALPADLGNVPIAESSAAAVVDPSWTLDTFAAPAWNSTPWDHAFSDTAAGDSASAVRIDQPTAPQTEVASENRVDPPQPHLTGPHLIKPFQPVWEVDVFDVPTTVADLFFEGDLFQQIAERMLDAVGDGLRTMLVTSTGNGEGRSSVAIGIAMAAAAAGIRVALVDADLEKPTLADDLRLELQHGWLDSLRRGLPLKEIAVHATEDGLTLIPLIPTAGSLAVTADETAQLFELLKDKFELVIIDGPSGCSPTIANCVAGIDSAVIVRDQARTSNIAVQHYSDQLRRAGVQGIGMVENFTRS